MNSSAYCYINGDFARYDKLEIHVSDLLIQRGYGVFDFFRCRNGSFPWLEDYTERLFHSMEVAGIEPGLERKDLWPIIQSLQEKNGFTNGAFKVIVTGGFSDNLESVTGPANFIILNLAWNRPPAETFEKGVKLVSDAFVRPNPAVKSLYYLNSLRLQKKLKESGAVEVMYHSDIISEASRANLFFVKEGRVSTPASNILRGITRKQVLSLFPKIHVEDIKTDLLYEFDELFMTSTSRDVTPIVSVDGRKIGKGVPGPVTQEIYTKLLESI